MAGEPCTTKVLFRKWANSVSWEREKTVRETCEGASWRKELSSMNGWNLANEEERGRHHVRPESWLVWGCSGGSPKNFKEVGWLGLEVQGRQGALHHRDNSARLPLASLLGPLLPLDHLSSLVGIPSAAQ